MNWFRARKVTSILKKEIDVPDQMSPTAFLLYDFEKSKSKRVCQKIENKIQEYTADNSPIPADLLLAYAKILPYLGLFNISVWIFRRLLKRIHRQTILRGLLYTTLGEYYFFRGVQKRSESYFLRAHGIFEEHDNQKLVRLNFDSWIRLPLRKGDLNELKWIYSFVDPNDLEPNLSFGYRFHFTASYLLFKSGDVNAGTLFKKVADELYLKSHTILERSDYYVNEAIFKQLQGLRREALKNLKKAKKALKSFGPYYYNEKRIEALQSSFLAKLPSQKEVKRRFPYTKPLRNLVHAEAFWKTSQTVTTKIIELENLKTQFFITVFELLNPSHFQRRPIDEIFDTLKKSCCVTEFDAKPLQFSSVDFQKSFSRSLEKDGLCFEFLLSHGNMVYQVKIKTPLFPNQQKEISDFVETVILSIQSASFYDHFKSVLQENLPIQQLKQVNQKLIHDVNAPLSVLNRMTHINAVSPEYKSFLTGSVEQIQNQIQHVKDVIEFKLTQTISNKQEGDRSRVESTNLLELIQEVVREKNLENLSKNETHHIFLSTNDKVTNAYSNVDSKELKAILSNLMNNAFEAIDSKEKKILVKLSRRSGWNCIKVADQGRGIPPSLLSKLGHLGHSYGKTDGKGYGLYHARIHTERWGGKFKLQSEQGVGTFVELLLPQFSEELKNQKLTENSINNNIDIALR